MQLRPSHLYRFQSIGIGGSRIDGRLDLVVRERIRNQEDEDQATGLAQPMVLIRYLPPIGDKLNMFVATVLLAWQGLLPM